jgi:hypothetical protein
MVDDRCVGMGLNSIHRYHRPLSTTLVKEKCE